MPYTLEIELSDQQVRVARIIARRVLGRQATLPEQVAWFQTLALRGVRAALMAANAELGRREFDEAWPTGGE